MVWLGIPPHITGDWAQLVCGSLSLGKQGVDGSRSSQAYGDEDKEWIPGWSMPSDMVLDFFHTIYQEHWNRIKFMEIGSKPIPYVVLKNWKNGPGGDIVPFRWNPVGILRTIPVFRESTGISSWKKSLNVMANCCFCDCTNQSTFRCNSCTWLANYAAGIGKAKKISGKHLSCMYMQLIRQIGWKCQSKRIWPWTPGNGRADLVITVSKPDFRQIVIERYASTLKRWSTVYNAVEPPDHPDMSEVSKHVQEKVSLFLAASPSQKGRITLWSRRTKCLRRNPNVRFVMAGSGDLLNKMIRRAASSHWEQNIHFTPVS